MTKCSTTTSEYYDPNNIELLLNKYTHASGDIIAEKYFPKSYKFVGLWRGLPVGHRGGDVSVVEACVPGEQDDTPVAEHAVEEQLTTHGETK